MPGERGQRHDHNLTRTSAVESDAFAEAGFGELRPLHDDSVEQRAATLDMIRPRKRFNLFKPQSRFSIVGTLQTVYLAEFAFH